MEFFKKIRNIHFKYGISLTIIICFLASILFPGVGESKTVETLITFVGILFGIIVGFFITDLYSRFQAIRENAAIDSSGLGTYYSFAKVLGQNRQNKKWLEKQRELINKYVKKFMPLPWSEYNVTEPEFSEIMDSLKEVKYKTDKENETYSNILAVLSEISDSREKLVMLGRDRLTRGEWTVVLALGLTLLVSLFYTKTMDIISIIFTGILSSTVIILMLVIRDLSNLKFGESVVSIEPYERVLDTIGKPRYYVRKK